MKKVIVMFGLVVTLFVGAASVFAADSCCKDMPGCCKTEDCCKDGCACCKK